MQRKPAVLGRVKLEALLSHVCNQGVILMTVLSSNETQND